MVSNCYCLVLFSTCPTELDDVQEEKGIKTSIDGKGGATDNIWIKRFLKTIIYNYIYLNLCDTGLELHDGVQIYIDFYHQKKHLGIGMKYNDEYYKSLKQNAA